MSTITFSENQDSVLVSYEDGLPLCSVKTPREEALKWAYSLGAMPTKHVIVIGLGSGFHISALHDLDPQLKISVVDNRGGLLSVFHSQFCELRNDVDVILFEKAEDILKSDLYQQVLNEHTFVLSFRESWGQQSKVFAEVFAHLTGRSIESLNYHFDNFGFDMKAHGLNEDKLLSIKDMIPFVEKTPTPDMKSQALRVLGELIK